MERGFSLIETLLVISLIGSLAAITLPSLSAWIPQHAVRLEARSVQLILERAYTLAITRAIPVEVHIAPNLVTVRTHNGTPLLSRHLRAPLTTRIKSGESGPLIFYPSHTASPATVLIEGPSYLCAVVVSLRGRTRRECA
jgi:prepilin-type N-terminal cleavage/methylation domain-containing protein